MNITIDETKETLSKTGYMANDRIASSLWASLIMEKPLLIEGAPGVGKTSAAKAIADGLGLDLIRVQMYDGLTDDKILYDYDYQRQLLTLEAIKPQLEEKYKDNDINSVIHSVSNELNFYGEDFLIKRPILRSITGEKRKVLLIDEIDKAPEEIEYMLYEFLEGYSITIPQYKEVVCPEDKRPLVFLTSNGYRELSGALKRRCLYLYIENKTKEEMVDILKSRANADDAVATGIAFCFGYFQNSAGIRQMPSISEAIDWANLLSMNPDRTKEFVINSLSTIVKNEKDANTIKKIVDENGGVLWNGEE